MLRHPLKLIDPKTCVQMRKFFRLSQLLLLPIVVVAQQPNRAALLVSSNSQIFNEAIVYPTENKTGLAIFFRLPYDRLVFSRNREGEGSDSFVAEVKVTIELYKDGRRITDQNWNVRKFAASFEETKNKQKDLTGVVHFQSDPGVYAWRMTLNEQPGMWRSIQLPNFSQENQIGRPFVLTNTTANALMVQNLAGNVAFGADGLMAAFVNAEAVKWHLLKIPDREVQKMQERMAREQQMGRERAGGRLGIPNIQERDNPENIKPIPDRADIPIPENAVEVAKGDVTKWLNIGKISPNETGLGTEKGDHKLALIPLETQFLEDGHYAIVLEAGDKKRHYLFSTLWRDMPMSLLNLDMAIESMKFIVEKDELRQLRKGKANERAERFRAWWKAKDPTPNTPFNELMAEYFARVDYAAMAFQTGTRGMDGLLTDRARIYITQGAPEKTSRLLPDSGGVREIWEYQSGQKFVFEAASSLDPFVLVK